MFDFPHIDVALSAWSIFIQLMINLPLFLLFLLSWLITKRKVFLTWTLAWALNLTALTMVLVVSNFFINTQTNKQIIFYAIYGVSKVLFAIVLLISSIQFSKKVEAINIPVVFLFSVGIVLFVIFLFFTPVIIQFFVYAFVFLMLYAGAYFCQQTKDSEGKVVAIGFFIHGSMFLHHFLIMLFYWLKDTNIPIFMSRISFFDAISEFIIALTFFLGVIIRIINELKNINAKLELNQERLRNLIEADPLTGLKNRRVLRKFFETIKGQNGCLAFVDVNNFKKINDNWGHEIGDKCLIELANGMRGIFRVDDGLFRLGGDEFLIVCPGLSYQEMKTRLEDFKKVIKDAVKGINLSVAVGIRCFDKESHIDEVLKQADKMMYRDKNLSKS